MNTDQIQKFIILLLKGMAIYEKLTLEKIGLDPETFDPPLSEISEILSRKVNNFYFYSSKFINHIDFVIKYKNHELAAPDPNHKVWQRYTNLNTVPSLEFLIDKSDYRTAIISDSSTTLNGKIKNSLIYLDGQKPKMPVKFVSDAASIDIGGIPGTRIKGKACIHEEICYFTHIKLTDIIYPDGYSYFPHRKIQSEFLFEKQRQLEKNDAPYLQPEKHHSSPFDSSYTP